MSRIARREIAIPTGVEVAFGNSVVTVKGPKGVLNSTELKDVNITIENGHVKTVARGKTKFSLSMAGTANSLIKSMIVGVTQGYVKNLEISGVGYRANVQGEVLTLNLGYSNPVVMNIPKGLTVEAKKPTQLSVSGIDKQMVGQFASQIRKKRPPEPYKGKGVRYADEQIIRKEGKKAGK